jgi:hypothetical protein
VGTVRLLEHFPWAITRTTWLRVFPAPKQSSRTPQEKESLQREIDATDKVIDKLVYELSPEGDDMG